MIRDVDGINPETLRTVLYVFIFRLFHEPEIVDLVRSFTLENIFPCHRLHVYALILDCVLRNIIPWKKQWRIWRKSHIRTPPYNRPPTCTIPIHHLLSFPGQIDSQEYYESSYDQYLPSNAHLILRRSSRHPAGEIWKHTFSICVHSDLEICKVSSNNRRFSWLEDRGLSGIILYEVPVTPGTGGYMHPSFTLEEAFGREENEYEDGMGVTELLDSTNARLVYFPSYACTSFFVRDTMNRIFMTNADRCR